MTRLFILTLLFATPLLSLAQVATYTFTSADPGNQPAKAVTTKDANLMASDIVRGLGITPSSATGSINATGWNSNAQDPNDYYEFTLTPNTGYQLTLTAFNASVRKSTAGPVNYLISYSIGGVETTAATGTIASANNADVAISASLSIHTAQAVRFRLYAWGAPNTTGTFRLDNALTVTGAAPLPVKLTSFTGRSLTKAVRLTWNTSWEEKNEGFDILKSQSATAFEKVGFVAGHTTTDTLTSYAFNDTDVEAGQVYYYKLRQRDIGGGSATSAIVAVRVVSEITSPLAVYPNPNRGQFSLSTGDASIAAIRLHSATGREIAATIISGSSPGVWSIETTAPAGLYYLQLQKADGTYATPVKVIIR